MLGGKLRDLTEDGKDVKVKKVLTFINVDISWLDELFSPKLDKYITHESYNIAISILLVGR